MPYERKRCRKGACERLELVWENRRLRKALEAAREALLWREGLQFEYEGLTVGQRIDNALGKSS